MDGIGERGDNDIFSTGRTDNRAKGMDEATETYFVSGISYTSWICDMPKLLATNCVNGCISVFVRNSHNFGADGPTFFLGLA